jgi:hypothetical protein
LGKKILKEQEFEIDLFLIFFHKMAKKHPKSSLVVASTQEPNDHMP